jgi:hypothetical protein
VLVALLDGSPDSGRERIGAGADVQDSSVVVEEHRDDLSVADQGLRGERGDLDAAGRTLGEHAHGRAGGSKPWTSSIPDAWVRT